MVDGKVKGVKDFYKSKRATYTPSEDDVITRKPGQDWVSVFFT